MSVFLLSEDITFPSPDLADEDGLLAVGGDLSISRLLKAYSMGIFPWYTEGSPILWWSPDPRLVLFPEEMRVSRSLRQCIRKGEFRTTVNTAFQQVIRRCATTKRKGQSGTWITEDMISAYIDMHKAGYAISAESWKNGNLAGGLYGVLIGNVFFGESMFSLLSNASKTAFVFLVEYIVKNMGVKIIDCQVRTEHLINFGAREIPRSEFIKLITKAIRK